MLYTEKDVLDAIDEYKQIVPEWKWKDGLSALHIDHSWFADSFSVSVIQMYFFYRQAPHEAFDVPYREQPALWAESVVLLNGILGPTL